MTEAGILANREIHKLDNLMEQQISVERALQEVPEGTGVMCS